MVELTLARAIVSIDIRYPPPPPLLRHANVRYHESRFVPIQTSGVNGDIIA